MQTMQVSGEFPISNHAHGDPQQMLSSSLHKRVHPYPVSEPGRFLHPHLDFYMYLYARFVCFHMHMMYELGSARWDERKEGGWKERMDDWKLQQGNLGPETDDATDPDMGMYVPKFIHTVSLISIVGPIS